MKFDTSWGGGSDDFNVNQTSRCWQSSQDVSTREVSHLTRLFLIILNITFHQIGGKCDGWRTQGCTRIKWSSAPVFRWTHLVCLCTTSSDPEAIYACCGLYSVSTIYVRASVYTEFSVCFWFSGRIVELACWFVVWKLSVSMHSVSNFHPVIRNRMKYNLLSFTLIQIKTSLFCWLDSMLHFVANGWRLLAGWSAGALKMTMLQYVALHLQLLTISCGTDFCTVQPLWCLLMAWVWLRSVLSVQLQSVNLFWSFTVV